MQTWELLRVAAALASRSSWVGVSRRGCRLLGEAPVVGTFTVRGTAGLGRACSQGECQQLEC